MATTAGNRFIRIGGVTLVCVIAAGYLLTQAGSSRPENDKPDDAFALPPRTSAGTAPAQASTGEAIPADATAPASVTDMTETPDLQVSDPSATAARAAADMERMQGLAKLTASGGRLKLNHDTRLIVENLLQTMSREEISRQMPHITDAVAQRLGDGAARDFAALVTAYARYIDTLSQMSARQNAQGVQDPDVAGAQGIRQQIQDGIFGAKDAEALFFVERRIMATMARNMAQRGSDPGEVTPDDVARMQGEYAAILVDESAR